MPGSDRKVVTACLPPSRPSRHEPLRRPFAPYDVNGGQSMDSIFLGLAIIAGPTGGATPGTIDGPARLRPATAPLVLTLRDAVAKPVQSASLEAPLRLER